ncbi:ClpXP protease specificity-enhancing factor [Ferrovum sp. PN-J185]|uniref:ClpXP protease specificity-enhancing factor n=1 Tax=Ferrovum sp. PN-J185 TaxID=1356306 RepID=UPI0007941B51|nr:ClpXP protease specificity-enhancing factor [Ferrovum sp. PN-J185]KXW56055.1 hypothetical protein FV185_12170 [Ferrovum sp. PN-J185]MCC6068233.1 ClpXP protease specificity-enhancing factor [Ferrovum sp. PN-J185]
MATSTKPYLARALWEWCCDNGFTPLIHVTVNQQTRVPIQFVKEGQIVLNISQNATRGLQMSNDSIQFNARFGGVSQEVNVPWSSVSGLYAKETGEGMFFDIEPDDSEDIELDNSAEIASTLEVEVASPNKKPRPNLTIIK